jgi:hypothetical protein
MIFQLSRLYLIHAIVTKKPALKAKKSARKTRSNVGAGLARDAGDSVFQ